ncbi:hypothetical protein WDU94_006698 [Cyamophila willieti]
MAPEFSSAPHEILLKAPGDVISFTCNIESVPSAVITWYYTPLNAHDTKTILPQPNKYLMPTPGTLYIINTSLDDSGNYSCSATNPLTLKTKTPSSWTLLNVVPRTSPLGPPRVDFLQPTLPLLRTPLEGDKLVLVCEASGRPHSPSLEWVYSPPPQHDPWPDEEPPREVLVPSEDYPGLSILTLTNLTLEQSGNYSCRRSPQSSPDGLIILGPGGPTYHVQVLQAPRIVSHPKSVSLPTAKTVRFECTVDGVPPPSVVWYKNGEKLLINGRIKQRSRELVMSNTVSDDAGIYQCVASNSAGETWAAGRFHLNASKVNINRPINPKCLPLGSSSIQISWEHVAVPKNPSKAFSIHILPSNAIPGTPEKEVVTTNQTLIVNKLEPFTNYTIYVRAYGISASEQSPSVTCMTQESVPIATPMILFPTRSAHWLNASWVPLSYAKARGDIVEYKVQWRLLDEQTDQDPNQSNCNCNTDLVPANVTNYVVTGLQPDTDYEFRILASTSTGYPSRATQSGWSIIHTRTDPNLPTPTLWVRPHPHTTERGVALLEWEFDGSVRATVVDEQDKVFNGEDDTSRVDEADFPSFDDPVEMMTHTEGGVKADLGRNDRTGDDDEDRLQGWRLIVEGQAGADRRIMHMMARERSVKVDELESNTLYKFILIGLFPQEITTDPGIRYLYTGPLDQTSEATLAPPRDLGAQQVNSSTVRIYWTPGGGMEDYQNNVTMSSGESGNYGANSKREVDDANSRGNDVTSTSGAPSGQNGKQESADVKSGGDLVNSATTATPLSGGEKENYVLSVRRKGSTEETMVTAREPFVFLSDLDPYTWYQFKVKTVRGGSAAFSQYSYTLEYRTPQSTSSQVRDITVRALNDTSIQVTWSPPDLVNGKLSMYLISFSLDLGQPWGTWPFVQVPSDTACYWDISGLEPHSTYFVTVQAVTQAGVSEASPIKTVVTLGLGETGQPSLETGYQQPPSSPGTIKSDQLLGIIVGCAIGALCVTLCTGTLLYKRRCSKPSLTPNPGGGGQCGSAGSAGCRVSPQRHRLEHGMMYEMDCLHSDKHTDTNGHDCYPNGGVLLPLISNGRVPTGAPSIVRITENPQLDAERCNGESDSLLSAVDDGHHTTYTTLLETSGVASVGEGGDSGFCGGGDDRLPLSLEGGGSGPPGLLCVGDQSESPNPPSPPLLPPPTVPSSHSPLSLDILVDDGFHEALTSLAEPSRYCTRNRGGVVSQC